MDTAYHCPAKTVECANHPIKPQFVDFTLKVWNKSKRYEILISELERCWLVFF